MACTTINTESDVPPVEEPKMKLPLIWIEPLPLQHRDQVMHAHRTHTVRLSIADEGVELLGSAKDFAIFARTMTQIAEQLAASEDEGVELLGSAKDFAIFMRTMTQIAERLAASEDA